MYHFSIEFLELAVSCLRLGEDACQKFLDNNEGSRVKVSSEKIVNLEYSVPICDGCDEFEEQTFSGNLSDGILLPEKPTKAGQWVFFIMKAD